MHAAYAQAKVVDVQYADEKGKLLDVSTAVATGAYRRNQIKVTYSNGLWLAVNGHPKDTWSNWGFTALKLPPNGWIAWHPDSGRLRAISSTTFDAHRTDFVDSPAYVYADGRGRLTRFFDSALVCDGQLIGHKHTDGTMEVIPVDRCTVMGVALGGKTATAVALDVEGKEIGPAATRFSRGLVHVIPVPKAFSYLVKPAAEPKATLTCARDKVIPGETVTVLGASEHTYQVPRDAKPGTLVWFQAEDAWIDFIVVPLVEAKLHVADELQSHGRKEDSDRPHPRPLSRERERGVVMATLALTANVPAEVAAEVAFAGEKRTEQLKTGAQSILEFPFKLEKEQVRKLPLVITAGDMRYERTWWLKAEEAIVPVAVLPEQYQGGECLRGGKQRSFAGNTGGQATRSEYSCGGVSRACIFMHPPYMAGTGLFVRNIRAGRITQGPAGGLPAA